MQYIDKKYSGQTMIETKRLRSELLLTHMELHTLQKAIAADLGKKICPYRITFQQFNNIIDLYL